MTRLLDPPAFAFAPGKSRRMTAAQPPITNRMMTMFLPISPHRNPPLWFGFSKLLCKGDTPLLCRTKPSLPWPKKPSSGALMARTGRQSVTVVEQERSHHQYLCAPSLQLPDLLPLYTPVLLHSLKHPILSENTLPDSRRLPSSVLHRPLL